MGIMQEFKDFLLESESVNASNPRIIEYSGRGMMGQTCFAIAVDDAREAPLRLLAEFLRARQKHIAPAHVDHDWEDFLCIFAEACCVDNIGKSGKVYYWPAVPALDDDIDDAE